MKASELIKNECCGVGLLSIEKVELVKRIEILECKNTLLENQLENAITEIQRLNKR